MTIIVISYVAISRHQMFMVNVQFHWFRGFTFRARPTSLVAKSKRPCLKIKDKNRIKSFYWQHFVCKLNYTVFDVKITTIEVLYAFKHHIT